MTHIGGDYFQTAIRAAPTGEQRTQSRIDLAYGTGTADEIYFTWHEDRLFELPMAWLHPQKRWGRQPFNPHLSGDFSRTTTTRCLECHNTWFEHVAGTENKYKRDSFLLGVTCERCHGPGREHVAFHQAHPGAAAREAIVHPGRLERDRLMDVCGQCHSNAVKPRGPPLRFRPGEARDSYFRIAANEYREEDHVADQVKYLRASKCYQKSDSLTCVTCHNPHQPSEPAEIQASCLKCHPAKDCAEQARVPAGVRGDCVGCHMPRFTRIQVFFHTEDDQYVPVIRPREHRIAIDPRARRDVLRAWYLSRPDAPSQKEAARLTKGLVDEWLAEAEALRRDYRYLAAIGALREALRLDSAESTREKLREVAAIQAKIDADWFDALHQIDQNRTAEAIDTLKTILALKPNLAKAHGKLGTLYAATEQPEPALEHLSRVARYDPDDAYGYAMLGWLAYLRGRAEDAAEAYRRADEIEPFDAKINYHRGLALAKLGQWKEAEACFRRVRAIDPTHAGGCQGLGEALRRQGRAEEGVRYARWAARLTDYRNADVLLTLAETYADAGRFGDADEAAAQALAAAQRGDPNQAALIRARREEFRARARQKAP
jgi:tetratricopeptide (TPR) repeat protein